MSGRATDKSNNVHRTIAEQTTDTDRELINFILLPQANVKTLSRESKREGKGISIGTVGMDDGSGGKNGGRGGEGREKERKIEQKYKKKKE